MMNQSMLGVAVVGTGFGQKVHIPGLQAAKGTQVVAVYHRDIDRATQIAKTHNIPYAGDNLTELLQLEEVEAVSLSTPPFLHYEMAKAAIEAKKHLLLEKPTALTAQEAKALYHLAQDRTVAATMDFEFRFVPHWQRFKELLDDGYVGNKRLIKIDWLVSSRADASRPWNWYAQKAMGGGALGAVGSHAFDYIYWLFGEIRQVMGKLSTAIPQRPDPQTGELKPVDADDTCLILLELADGTPCQLCISSVAYNGRGHWVEVYGDRATLILGSSNQKDYVHGFSLQGGLAGEPLAELEIPQRLAFSQTFEDGRIAPFVRVVENWCKAITTQMPVTPSLKEGVYSQLLMDLTHQSHQSNQAVEVPSLVDFLA